MLAFQINMTFGHYTVDYLKEWLQVIADNGYDTILWEVEDAVRWDTCPEVAAEDAFSKAEFKTILDYAANLGLKAIPLLQTFAHCEYVLRHKEYYHLSEHPEFVELYCPTKPEVKQFLKDWIAEYIELFGKDIPCFHLGGDEAWPLGGNYCDGSCPEYMENHTKSELYVQQLTALAEPLLEMGIKPAIWADMILKHGDALDMLSRDIMLFDWQYELRDDVNKVWKWEDPQGLCSPGEMPDELKSKYANYLPDTFYTADYLKAKGFKVIGCPASSCYGDNVFAPQTELHLQNTAGWMKKYQASSTDGFLLTSWSVHLLPFEMQLPTIMLPGFMKNHPEASLDDFKRHFCKIIFNDDSITFFDAVNLLEKNCLFSHTSTLGFNSYHRVIPDNHVAKQLEKVDKARELTNCQERLKEYETALGLLETMHVNQNQPLIDLWILQAKNLINRAKLSSNLLAGQTIASELLNDMQNLKLKTQSMYQSKLKTNRAIEAVYWQFDLINNHISMTQ